MGFLPVAPHTEPGAQLHLPAAGRRREERAAHKMHRRRGSYAQRGEPCTRGILSCITFGKIHPCPHSKSTSRMYHPAIAASRYKSLGSLYTPCARPGQATAIAATLFVTASQPAWANKGFPARCLRALITTWQSRLVSSRQPGDDGSNCQVKVGIPHETNRTLNFPVPLPVLPVSILTCLAGAALVPVVVQSLGLKHNLWLPVPTALRRAAPFVTPGLLHDAISATEFAIYLCDSLIAHT